MWLIWRAPGPMGERAVIEPLLGSVAAAAGGTPRPGHCPGVRQPSRGFDPLRPPLCCKVNTEARGHFFARGCGVSSGPGQSPSGPAVLTRPLVPGAGSGRLPRWLFGTCCPASPGILPRPLSGGCRNFPGRGAARERLCPRSPGVGAVCDRREKPLERVSARKGPAR